MAAKVRFTIGDMDLEVNGIRDDGKPKLADKVIIAGRHVTYMWGGQLYSTRVTHSGHYGRRWGSYLTLIKEALTLGALPKSRFIYVKMAEIERKRDEDSRKRQAAADALNSITWSGIKVPASLLRSLRRKARRSKK